MKRLLILFVAAIGLQSCEIKEEIRFNADGSGTYGIGFDMSEMMKMGDSNDSVPQQKVVDTLINFATFLDQKKDSIATLSLEEQERLESLRPLQFKMNMNEEAKEMRMDIAYKFNTIDDIYKLKEVMEIADIKELGALDPTGGLTPANETETDSVTQKDGMSEIFGMAESFNTSFSATKFTRNITEKALAESIKTRDTTLKKDDPFADMIRFTQVYHFPFKIKSVSNPNAKILSDFKGVEIQANMYEMNTDPKYFNLEVLFEE